MIWFQAFILTNAIVIVILAVLGFIWFILPIVILALLVIAVFTGVYQILKANKKTPPR